MEHTVEQKFFFFDVNALLTVSVSCKVTKLLYHLSLSSDCLFFFVVIKEQSKGVVCQQLPWLSSMAQKVKRMLLQLVGIRSWLVNAFSVDLLMKEHYSNFGLAGSSSGFGVHAVLLCFDCTLWLADLSKPYFVLQLVSKSVKTIGLLALADPGFKRIMLNNEYK